MLIAGSGLLLIDLGIVSSMLSQVQGEPRQDKGSGVEFDYLETIELIATDYWKAYEIFVQICPELINE